MGFNFVGKRKIEKEHTDEVEEMISELRKTWNYDCFETEMGGDGVRVSE